MPNGEPYRNGKTNGHTPRRDLVEAMNAADRQNRRQTPPADIEARYDAAENGNEFSNYWAKADRLSPDASNSREVRHTLVSR